MSGPGNEGPAQSRAGMPAENGNAARAAREWYSGGFRTRGNSAVADVLQQAFGDTAGRSRLLAFLAETATERRKHSAASSRWQLIGEGSWRRFWPPAPPSGPAHE